jgi:hypothetical protein
MRAAAIAAPGLSIFGAVLGEGRSGTANARIGIKALYDTLKDTAGQAITQAGLDAGQRARIRAGMGIAGISRPGIREALEQLDFGFATAYASDSLIANLGAHGGGDGAILIIGTGSAAQLRVAAVSPSAAMAFPFRMKAAARRWGFRPCATRCARWTGAPQDPAQHRRYRKIRP